MTVGELRALLANIDDDVEVAVSHADDFIGMIGGELGTYTVRACKEGPFSEHGAEEEITVFILLGPEHYED